MIAQVPLAQTWPAVHTVPADVPVQSAEAPQKLRSATQWPDPGPCFRIHAGLEHIDDLIADMDAGFKRLRAAR